MSKLGLIAVTLAAAVAAASAADYPDRPIRFIVPQAAGSATDTVARILAAGLRFDDFRPLHGRLQAAADGLDFGQFGHGGVHLVDVT